MAKPRMTAAKRKEVERLSAEIWEHDIAARHFWQAAERHWKRVTVLDRKREALQVDRRMIEGQAGA